MEKETTPRERKLDVIKKAMVIANTVLNPDEQALVTLAVIESEYKLVKKVTPPT